MSRIRIKNPFLYAHGVLIIGLVFIAMNVSSQSVKNPWTVGASWHWFDYQAVQYKVADQLTKAHWIGEVWPSKFSVGRMIIPSLDVEASYALQRFDQDLLVIEPGEIEIPLSKQFWWNADLELQYSFANGYLIKESSWFAPYLFGAGGATQVDGVAYLMLDCGVGINFWIHENFGLNFEAAYDYVPDFYDYLHYSAGLKIQVGKAQDIDQDGIPDKKDACPFVAGLIEFDGCPDTDRDGLIDSLDRCPTVKGPIALMGCPDTDGDGIVDIDDQCPNEQGPQALLGCPDRDNDGVADKDDLCPEEWGKKELRGCPDRDGDGITDLDDRCPDVAGKKEFGGCPDTDGDGIPDVDDECLDQPGTVSTKGCPDTDRDLVPDKDDLCPTIPGIMALKGCPDSDGDGVPDNEDRCPNQKGTLDNFGCPLVDTITIIKQVEEQIRVEAEQIQFETAKYIIRPVSYPSLNRIVDILNKYPGSRFAIDGHTDSVGDDDYNLELSRNRALAVKQFFIDRGIASNRLIATGYGETRPIATNSTVEGRALNRRVEIHFIDK